MPTAANRRCSAGRRLVSVAQLSGALVHKLPVHGSEDSLLALTEPWVGLGRLRHRHDRLSVQLVTRGKAKMASKRVRRKPQHPLQLGHPLRLGCRLTGQPLRDRRLGHAQRSGKLPLGQAAVGTSAPERPREVLPLIGRRHVRVLLQVGAT
jgi:hypothetical protein